MENSYKFFRNTQCEFFPCHKVEKVENFNCMFCYCPLYREERCLGNPEYVISRKGQRIKDCSNCLLVHQPEMYDMVFGRLQREDELLHIDLRKLKTQVKERLMQITHINEIDADMKYEHQINIDRILDEVMKDMSGSCVVDVLLQEFAPECICPGYFTFCGKKIECGILTQIDTVGVEKGYLYAFHAPEIDIESAGSVLEQYYMEAFQVACMDVIRGWLQGYLERKNSVYEKKYCSPSFGPGYYGMGMDAVPELLGLMDASQVGVSWNGERMSPKMSLVGTYLIAGEDVFAVGSDCKSCIGQKGGCEFCIKH